MFKLFMFDVGILGAMVSLDPKTLLNYQYGSYKGYFAENFVLQQLTSCYEDPIVNWQEVKNEVEFLVQHEGEIIPIEVKSGHVVRAQSLKKYSEKYHPNKSMILSAKRLQIDNQKSIYRLPLYYAERVFSCISQ